MTNTTDHLSITITVNNTKTNIPSLIKYINTINEDINKILLTCKTDIKHYMNTTKIDTMNEIKRCIDTNKGFNISNSYTNIDTDIIILESIWKSFLNTINIGIINIWSIAYKNVSNLITSSSEKLNIDSDNITTNTITIIEDSVHCLKNEIIDILITAVKTIKTDTDAAKNKVKFDAFRVITS